MAANYLFPIGSYCSSHGWGGLEMNVSRFLSWMRGRGWPVFLYADPESEIVPHAESLNIPVRGVRCGSEVSALWKAPALAKLAGSDGVRVLIAHQSSDLLLCSMAKRWSGGRLKIIFSQNMHLGNKRDPIHAWQYRTIDAFVAPLPLLAEQARRQTVVPAEKIHIIPHGIEQNRFVSLPDRATARRELGLPIDATILGIIGRLDPKKGQHVGIRALGRLHAEGYRPHLLIVGDPTIGEGNAYRNHLHELVNKLGLEKYVHFRPYQDKAEVAYGAMDIFILTSQSETYGLVTIEAMTGGLPVIGTDSGGTIDLIAHERNGLRFPPDDDGALAAMLKRYLDDPPMAERLAAQGKKDALAQYSHEAQCAAWEGLMRGMVE
ncbi:MAG: glycosyltransferase family 4 protein [candidate division Zixibacteria bacterium]|nr:glycosyltransferase family 4 protein [candidate division Zixibacteria bacterium]